MPDFDRPIPIRAEHRTVDFQCGHESLDRFLARHALDKQNAQLSRTYVVTMGSADVIAYYTLAHLGLAQRDLPKRLGRGMPDQIPALLLARLAVHTRWQGHGLGRRLFRDAMQRARNVVLVGAAPIRLFAVDALDSHAKAFYERLNMRCDPAEPMRLYLTYKDILELGDHDIRE